MKITTQKTNARNRKEILLYCPLPKNSRTLPDCSHLGRYILISFLIIIRFPATWKCGAQTTGCACAGRWRASRPSSPPPRSQFTLKTPIPDLPSNSQFTLKLPIHPQNPKPKQLKIQTLDPAPWTLNPKLGGRALRDPPSRHSGSTPAVLNPPPETPPGPHPEPLNMNHEP